MQLDLILTAPRDGSTVGFPYLIFLLIFLQPPFLKGRVIGAYKHCKKYTELKITYKIGTCKYDIILKLKKDYIINN